MTDFLPCLTEPYLGNQQLSYGQNLSFLLRLDRGVRYPSVNDVILEGDGLRVAASLGDLRLIVPCGQKISYSFRSENQPAETCLQQDNPSQCCEERLIITGQGLR